MWATTISRSGVGDNRHPRHPGEPDVADLHVLAVLDHNARSHVEAGERLVRRRDSSGPGDCAAVSVDPEVAQFQVAAAVAGDEGGLMERFGGLENRVRRAGDLQTVGAWRQHQAARQNRLAGRQLHGAGSAVQLPLNVALARAAGQQNAGQRGQNKTMRLRPHHETLF
jgi:hypothetical protein